MSHDTFTYDVTIRTTLERSSEPYERVLEIVTSKLREAYVEVLREFPEAVTMRASDESQLLKHYLDIRPAASALETAIVHEKDGVASLVCPHCGRRNTITEQDEGSRDNVLGDDSLEVEDGVLVAVDFIAGDPNDWQHLRFYCRACDKDVSLPDDPDVNNV